MSTSRERGENKYQFLEEMSTEKLKSIIMSDFLSGDSDDEANDEFVNHVLEVIAQQEENNPLAPQFDVESEWQKFQSKFFSVDESASQEKSKQIKTDIADKAKSSRSKWIVFRPLRIATITVIVVLFSIMMASALELDLFNMIAEWTQEIFQFKSEAAPQYELKVVPGTQLNRDQTLEAALEEQGISVSISPTWIPEGYEFSGIQVYKDVIEPILGALYEDQSTNRFIMVSVVTHEKPKSTVHEKDETPVSIYLKNDIEHFIMRNNKSITATWFVENLECTITGGVSEDEMKTMIDSIYGGSSN